MAKYQIRENTSVTLDPVSGASAFFRAEPSAPEVIELPDDLEPSLKWTALDEAARKAKKKLAEFRAQPADKKAEQKEKEKLAREEEESKAAESSIVAAKQHDKEVQTAENKGGHKPKPASPL